MKKTTKRPDWLRNHADRKREKQEEVRRAKIYRKRERETMTLAIGGTAG